MLPLPPPRCGLRSLKSVSRRRDARQRRRTRLSQTPPHLPSRRPRRLPLGPGFVTDGEPPRHQLDGPPVAFRGTLSRSRRLLEQVEGRTPRCSQVRWPPCRRRPIQELPHMEGGHRGAPAVAGPGIGPAARPGCSSRSVTAPGSRTRAASHRGSETPRSTRLQERRVHGAFRSCTRVATSRQFAPAERVVVAHPKRPMSGSHLPSIFVSGCAGRGGLRTTHAAPGRIRWPARSCVFAKRDVWLGVRAHAAVPRDVDDARQTHDTDEWCSQPVEQVLLRDRVRAERRDLHGGGTR
jgi:hypothetical protein